MKLPNAEHAFIGPKVRDQLLAPVHAEKVWSVDDHDLVAVRPFERADG
jgi:hypothetical protein